MAARKKGHGSELTSNFFELQRVIASHLLSFDKAIEMQKTQLAIEVASLDASSSHGDASAENPAARSAAPSQAPESVIDQFKAMFTAGKISMRAGTLPEHATKELLYWFLDNVAHPYPDTKERQRLATKCGLEGEPTLACFAYTQDHTGSRLPCRISSSQLLHKLAKASLDTHA